MTSVARECLRLEHALGEVAWRVNRHYSAAHTPNKASRSVLGGFTWLTAANVHAGEQWVASSRSSSNCWAFSRRSSHRRNLPANSRSAHRIHLCPKRRTHDTMQTLCAPQRCQEHLAESGEGLCPPWRRPRASKTLQVLVSPGAQVRLSWQLTLQQASLDAVHDLKWILRQCHTRHDQNTPLRERRCH